MKKLIAYRTRFNSYLDNRIYVALELLAAELNIPKSRIIDEALMLLFRSRGYELSDYEVITEMMGLDWTYFAGLNEAINANLVRCEGKRSKGYKAAKKDVRNNLDSPFSEMRISSSLSIVEDERNFRVSNKRAKID